MSAATPTIADERAVKRTTSVGLVSTAIYTSLAAATAGLFLLAASTTDEYGIVPAGSVAPDGSPPVAHHPHADRDANRETALMEP
jgi:hypothetical protein